MEAVVRDQINRILKLVEDGKLTGEQASEMLAALDKARRDAGRHGGGRRRAGRHRDGHHRRRHEGGLGDFLEGVGSDLRRVVQDALRDAKASDALRGVFDDEWVNDSNDAAFAQTEEPSGKNYRLRDNRLVVARLTDLQLDEAEFCGNELHASALQDVAVSHGVFNDNALRGSSLRRASIRRSAVTNNRCNGAQIRALSLVDSKLHSVTLNGVKLKNMMLRDGARLVDVEMSGVAASDWVLAASSWSGGKLKGATIADLSLTNASLTDCTFGNRKWTLGRRRGDGDGDDFFDVNVELATIRGLSLTNVTLKGCEFINCVFQGTTIRDLELAGPLRFEGVDFTGLTVSSAEQLRKLAGTAHAA